MRRTIIVLFILQLTLLFSITSEEMYDAYLLTEQGTEFLEIRRARLFDEADKQFKKDMAKMYPGYWSAWEREDVADDSLRAVRKLESEREQKEYWVQLVSKHDKDILEYNYYKMAEAISDKFPNEGFLFIIRRIEALNKRVKELEKNEKDRISDN